MKLFYGIILVLVVFVSACAPQAAQPEAEPSTPEAQPAEAGDSGAAIEDEETDTDGTGAAVAASEEVVVVETGSVDVRFLGADGGFDTEELTLSTGSSVTWYNDDSKNMVVIVFKDGRNYATPRLNPGQQKETVFDEPGEYNFWWNLAYAPYGGTITVE